MFCLMISILINQGSVWDGFGYILTIILFSLLYNVTKFFEFKTKYSLCAEVNMFMIFNSLIIIFTSIIILITSTLMITSTIILITSTIMTKTDTYQELPTVECFKLWGNGTNG